MRVKPAISLGVIAATACLCGLVLPSCSSPKHEHPNIVLVVVDALRPDYLGCYGCDRPTSPNIDKLARQATVFQNAVTHAPWTKTSFSSFLTSLYPFEHGVVGWESVMPDSVVTLPEVLEGAGYSTMAVINMLGITGEFKVTKGIAKISEADKNRDALGTSADAIALMKAAHQPFFILIHYFDTHRPYRVAAEYVDPVRKPGDPEPFAAGTEDMREGEKVPPEVIARERLLYAGCVRFVDTAVAKVIDYLDSAGLTRDTIFIITADHGEALWDHGAVSHGGNLYDEAIKVPLILSYPAEYGRGQRLDAQVRHVDLLPTILDLAGISDSRRREGTSLRPLIAAGKRQTAPARFVPQDVTVCESGLKKAPDSKCVRTNYLKLIVEPATALSELYDLKSDPKEVTNLWGRPPAGTDSLVHMLARVPGTTVGGWRVAVTGAGKSDVDVDIALPKGGRIIGFDKVTAPAGLAVELAADSTSAKIHAYAKGLQMVLFDVAPPDSRVTFKVDSDKAAKLGSVSVGRAGQKRVGERFTVGPQDALGLPEVFEQQRTSATAGVHVWWLAGEKMRMAGERAGLSSEAKKRLKSLGYVQ
jgi:arylsulfatase A-like enzyme